MQPDDTLTLIGFSDLSQTCFSLRMDNDGRLSAKQTLEALQPQQMTNLSAGLIHALSRAKAVAEGYRLSGIGLHRLVSKVLLFTDGETNRGILGTSAILEAAERKRGTMNIGVSTFGVGTTYNGELLGSISAFGRGAHYYLDTAERIPTAFGTEFGTLVGTYARNVRLLASAPDGIEFELINPLKSTNKDGLVEVECDDLLSEQTYNVVFSVKIPKRSKVAKAPVSIMSVLGYMTEVSSGQSVTLNGEDLELNLTTAKGADKEDDIDVMRIVSTAIAARDHRDALELAKKGDVAGARRTLISSVGLHRGYGNDAMAVVTQTVADSAYASNAAYTTVGAKLGSTVSWTLNTQSAGTGGANVGGVDVDALYATPDQSKMAAMFSITKSATPSDDDMPAVADMVTTR